MRSCELGQLGKYIGVPLFVATPRFLNCAMHPLHCAKVDVRTHFRKGLMGRELAIHHFSQGRRRKHIAPPSFSRGTELQHDASLAVLRPCNGVPHSGPRPPSKSRAEHERTRTPDSHNNLFSTPCCAPHLHRGATESPSLWPRPTVPVTLSAVARLPRACHTPQWATAVLLARSSCIARHDGAGLHLARRLPTRCLRGLPVTAAWPVPSQDTLLRHFAFVHPTYFLDLVKHSRPTHEYHSRELG